MVQSNASVSGMLIMYENKNIEDSYSSITRLAYGKNGLVNFLNQIFFTIGEEDRKQFNYYFALKEHLCYLNDWQKPAQKLPELLKGTSNILDV